MKTKLFVILFLAILLIGFISAQANYSKCLPEDDYMKKKMEKSIIRKILLSFLPIGWVNWLTGYATYKEEINCVINETNNLEVPNV